MKRPRLIAFCVLLMFVAGSGFVFSQSIDDAFKEFSQGYANEFLQTEEQIIKRNEYYQAINQLRAESHQAFSENMNKLLEERMNTLGPNSTVEERVRIVREVGKEASFDNEYALAPKVTEKEREIFPDALEKQKRQFQLREGITKRLESFGDPQDILLLLESGHPVNNSFAQPDFLELTPEQRDLIRAIRKESFLKREHIRIKSQAEQPEKEKEFMQLFGLFSTAKTFEEQQEIHRKMQEIEADMLKNYIPELKAILIQERESYLRVLTDAQKAKIVAVMDDMPDYMRNLFAAIDKQGGGLSILHNWQPGMGVPDGSNPNREAPRERTNTPGRTFPGN